MIGKQIQHYKIIEKLGAGGMGEVYLAEDTTLKRRVALKLITPALSNDPHFVARFRHEAQAAAALDHPNIVTVYELGEHESQLFIAMQYVRGQTLHGLIKSGKLTLKQSLNIAQQICEGLSEAHQAGIVHRDIKPGNILYTKDSVAKILDFGIAKISGATKLTKEGSTLGTVQYQSPEQCRGEKTDQRSDLFSLGIVLYEMITGKLPFTGDYEESVRYAISHEEAQPLSRFASGITDEIQRLVSKLLQKDVYLRYQGADDVLADLKAIKQADTTRDSRTVDFKRKMLVVLPLENLGSAKDDYFADGITDKIASKLAHNTDLGVISRTTARQYKGTNKKLQTIASELRVDFVLEGSIRWDKSGQIHRVRINTRLIQVSDDTQLWAGVYQEDMKDIFQIQVSVASEIANALGLNVWKHEQGTVMSEPTENLAAYQSYLHGIDYAHRIDFHEDDLRMALQMFERAVRLDPEYAVAHAELSQSHAALYHFGYDQTEDRISSALGAVQRALELQPGLPEGHFALGTYYYWIHKDYGSALQELKIAESALPSEMRIQEQFASIYSRMGDFETSLKKKKEILQLSPRDPLAAHVLAIVYLFMRKNAEVDKCYDQSIILNPDQEFAYLFKAWNFWQWRGDLKKARAIFDQIPESKRPRTNWYWYVGYQQRLFERDYSAALDWLSGFPSATMEEQWYVVPKARLDAVAYELLGKRDQARKASESALRTLENELDRSPNDHRIHGSIGVVYASLGLKDRGILHGKRGVDLCPPSKDAIIGPSRVEDLAQIYTLVSEHEAAMDQIEYLLSIPGLFSAPMFRLDPRWDPLRENPRFHELLKKYEN